MHPIQPQDSPALRAPPVKWRIPAWVRALLRPPSARLLVLLLAGYGVAGAWIVRDARAEPALAWMHLYRFEDVGSVAEAWRFFAALRTGIPPVLALLEVVEHLLTGDVWWTDAVLYRAGLLGAFALPLLAFRRSILESLASLALCLLFLASVRIIATPNAQLYDPLLPLFLIAALLGLEAARRWPRQALPLAAAAGTGLALAELSRAFVLLLLPVLVTWGWLVLRALPLRCRVAFLVPLLLLSGGWHAKLLLRDGQILWSNHGGFNLYRAWTEEVDAWPEYAGGYGWFFEWRGQGELGFRGSGDNFRWRWDTQSHADRSRELTATVVRHWLRAPVSSGAHAARRISVLLLPRVRVGRGAALGVLKDPYRWAVRLASLLFAIQIVLLVAGLVRAPSLEAFARLETAWCFCGVCLIVLLAIGDRGEEARFLISVLPFLAALPRGSPAPITQRA